MIYLIGGAPRTGKSILGQQVAANLKIGWISTDILLSLLHLTKVEGIKTEWNASPKAIAINAEWFFPYLERFVWGASSLAENYLIEGVDFLPAQVKKLSSRYQLRAVFLGCSQMTLAHFDRFPGRSHGYSRYRMNYGFNLPKMCLSGVNTFVKNVKALAIPILIQWMIFLNGWLKLNPF